MPGKHKNPTISFRVSDSTRKEIEAKIKASGMQKKDYFTRSCIYNKVCVVGSKENILPLVEEVRNLRVDMKSMYEQITSEEATIVDIEDKAEEYLNLLEAVIWLLDGAKCLR